MCAVNQLQRTGEESPAAGQATESTKAQVLPTIIKAEANLLQLPLFALHTKGLKNLDGLECRGRTRRHGQMFEFTFRATRNTATAYPGPLARAAHLAFLSLITEAGLPFQNPLTWTWRDLCRRMGVVCGGQMVRHLKEAITATAALLLHSDFAIYDKPGGSLICTQQESLHLYERVAFVGSVLADGRKCDGNYLWISDWYLQNLNALFTAPLDYSLWRYLDERSTIASRLYEFLLRNFYSGTPILKINYETLVQFLPIKAERYRSSARNQLDPALQLLTDARIIAAAEWCPSKNGLGLLALYRGPLLASAASPESPSLPALPLDDHLGTMQVQELCNLKPAESSLVSDFYRLWNGGTHVKPTAKELEQAKVLISQVGEAKAKKVLPILVKKLKVQWPEAKTFAAAAYYVSDAVRDLERQQRKEEIELNTQHEEHKAAATEAVASKDNAALKILWQQLPEQRKQAIESAVLQKHPKSLKKFPDLLERLCLLEFRKGSIRS